MFFVYDKQKPKAEWLLGQEYIILSLLIHLTPDEQCFIV